MLQPELPCFNDFTDNDDFSAPPELLLPDRLIFDDECGPPRLEPQVPITLLPETSEQAHALRRPQLNSNPTSPPSTETSPIQTNNQHPLLAHQPILAAMLMSTARLPPSSPKFSVQSPTVSTTADYINTNGKRERSVSVESSDVMLKMPKLIPMVEECEREVSEEQKPQLESTISLIENTEELENTAPPALDSQTTSEVEAELMKQVDEEEPEAKVEPIEEVVEEKKPKDTTTEKHETSLASSSGVSSANSSLLAEEPPIIIRFKRPVEAKVEPVDESEK